FNKTLTDFVEGIGGTTVTIPFADVVPAMQRGVADCGVTGLDILRESGRDVAEVMDLGFGSCTLTLAVPEASKVQRPEDVPDGARVATSFPNLTGAYFSKLGKKVQVIQVSGATEITPHVGVADCITDLVSTGSTLAVNHLRPVGDILRSTARLVAHRASLADPRRGAALREIAFALESVVAAKGKRYLMANVPRDRLDEVRKILPGISGPTIVEVASQSFVAAHAVVDEDDVYRAVNQLKAIGATGILVLPIERLVA
ncbi:MAG: ATP phosphoribosyltransferase, partial [Methanobacteriota archaeon]